jgi:hypothetical protein
MDMSYHHKQTGWVVLIGFGLTFLSLLILSIFLATHVSALSALMPLFSAAAIAVLIAMFSSMTVEITDDTLSWFFGPRFWKKTISLAQIEDATPIQTKWYWGYGVKFFGPDRWLYNVSGLEAVEIKLKMGGWVRIGTDDATGLLQALKPAAFKTRHLSGMAYARTQSNR